jgi:hypothetical protein
MNSTKSALYPALIALSIISVLLLGMAAFRYSYSTLSAMESAMGFIVLLVITGSLWLYRNRPSRTMNSAERSVVIFFGMTLGLLWVIEISINNFVAPPLPARDIIDNIFWAVIAFSILIFSVARAYIKDSLVHGIEVGIWSGFVSGLLACCMGLLIIVFGMGFIQQDPLNVSEWAGIRMTTNVPNMAAYFAFETLAGAFGHLVVLGVIMGGLLGFLGGSIGKGCKRIILLMRESR